MGMHLAAQHYLNILNSIWSCVTAVESYWSLHIQCVSIEQPHTVQCQYYFLLLSYYITAGKKSFEVA